MFTVQPSDPEDNRYSLIIIVIIWITPAHTHWYLDHGNPGLFNILHAIFSTMGDGNEITHIYGDILITSLHCINVFWFDTTAIDQ